jgi:predicted enzyme related to lactoylglutathione lyase
VIEHIFAGLPISDFARAVAWYRQLFGRDPDVVVRDDEEVMWQLVDAGWLYIVRDEERAGRGLFTMLVDDLAVEVKDLAARGITIPEMETRPGLFRRVKLTDPDDNVIAVGESLSDSDSSRD